ncbi:MAG TPA: hypothetical protein VG013_21170 [Gemmataceae bacterium]|jgi:hypothetical protein|nr:hypothetical protein [Gemmataceae bacterium]
MPLDRAMLGERSADLQTRYAALRRDMLEHLEQAVAVENQWLMFMLLGWEHLATCAASYYLVEVQRLQYPHRWPYALLWLVQTVVALGTVLLFRAKQRIEPSPLQRLTQRVGLVFLALCCDVAVLNAAAGLPVFVFLPVLATLSSFAFLALSMLVSGRFLFAALTMFVTGSLMARYPTYGFLLYGGSWLLILQTLGVILFVKRRRMLAGCRAGKPVFQTGGRSLSTARQALARGTAE